MRIKKIRNDKKMTQLELAKAAGIAVNSLRLYESNKRQPRIEQLNAIAKALGTSPTYLLGAMNDEGTIDLGLVALEIAELTGVEAVFAEEVLKSMNPPYPISAEDFQKIIKETRVRSMREKMKQYLDKEEDEIPREDGLNLGKLLADSFAEEKIISDIDLTAERIKQSLSKLNNAGCREAIKRVEELTEIPKYQKTQK